MLGLQRRALPLVLGVVGDAVQPDLAVRPGLHAGPFDAKRQVLRFAQRPDVDDAGRAAGAAAVDAHDRVAVRHPFLGIDHLPALVLVGRAGRNVGMDFAHPVPLLLVEVREVQPLAVGAVGQDHRIPALLDRTVDVAAQHQPVVHLDRHVPVDPHAVADFADFAIAHGGFLPGYFSHIAAARRLSSSTLRSASLRVLCECIKSSIGQLAACSSRSARGLSWSLR